MNDDETTATDRPSRGFVLSAILIASVLILGVVLSASILLGGDKDQENEAASSTTTSASSTQEATGTPDGKSKCGLPAGDDSAEYLDEAPAASWSLVGQVAVPSAEGSGPGVVEQNGFRSCYAHTAEGVALAGANYLAVMNRPDLVEEAAKQLVAQGPGRDAMLKQGSAGWGAGDPDVRLQIAGVRMVTYQPEAASVVYLLESNQGQLAELQLDLLWQDGDWRVEVAADGTPKVMPRSVPDATGFLPWAGV